MCVGGGGVVGTQPPNFSKPGEQKFVGPPRDSRKPFLSPSIKFSVCFQRLQKWVSLSQPRGAIPWRAVSWGKIGIFRVKNFGVRRPALSLQLLHLRL